MVLTDRFRPLLIKVSRKLDRIALNASKDTYRKDNFSLKLLFPNSNKFYAIFFRNILSPQYVGVKFFTFPTNGGLTKSLHKGL